MWQKGAGKNGDPKKSGRPQNPWLEGLEFWSLVGSSGGCWRPEFLILISWRSALSAASPKIWYSSDCFFTLSKRGWKGRRKSRKPSYHQFSGIAAIIIKSYLMKWLINNERADNLRKHYSTHHSKSFLRKWPINNERADDFGLPVVEQAINHFHQLDSSVTRRNCASPAQDIAALIIISPSWWNDPSTMKELMNLGFLWRRRIEQVINFRRCFHQPNRSAA